MKKTKIIGTIGPASLQLDELERMYKKGMDCVRINTAYGSPNLYKSVMDNVREIADIPIILDIKGPEIRLQAEEDKHVEEGDLLEIGFEKGEFRFNHDIYSEISVDDEIFIDNGKIRSQVVGKEKGKLKLRFLEEGGLSDGKGVNIPSKQLLTPTLTEKDLSLIEFAKEMNIDYLAYSYTRNARDINHLRSKLKNSDIEIIAKIENLAGLNNFGEILDSADSIMVARGDLGIEISLEKVPMAQKSIIRQCNIKGKTVITATEMLESMIEKPEPTRAEVSDVANAILDGTDAVMLSGETSIGKYPAKSVSMIKRIAKEVETNVKSQIWEEKSKTLSETISKAIQRICQDKPIDKIVTLTRSGFTARMISRFKLSQPILAVAPVEGVKRRLEIAFGVIPVHFDYLEKGNKVLSTAKKLLSSGLVEKNETVLFTAAFGTAVKHASNMIEIHEIKDLLNSG